MGHIILIKTSFFLCKTHFLIKLRGAALGSHQDNCWVPPSMSNKKSRSRFPLKILRRWRKLSDLVEYKCTEKWRKWEGSESPGLLPSIIFQSSKFRGFCSRSKVVQMWPQCLCLPPAHTSSWQGVLSRAQGTVLPFPWNILNAWAP